MWTRPPGLKGILFDKDGTLIDFAGTWTRINRQAVKLASAGDTILERKLLVACGTDPATGQTAPDSLFASGNAREIAEQMSRTGSPFTVSDLNKRLDELFLTGATNAIAITDLAGMFEEIKSLGLVTGIASSDAEASIRTTMDALNFGDHVDFVSGYDSGYGSKPDPGMVHAFCAHAGCDPFQVVVVGDNRHDLEMGHLAGCGGKIGVLSGTGTHSTLGLLADVILDDVGKLPELLRS